MKKTVKVLSFLLVCVLTAVMVLPGTPQKVRADGGYSISFSPTGTHTVVLDNGNVKVDGEFVALKDGGGNSIGTAVENNGNIQIEVDNNTPGVLNYNSSNKFTLYDTVGHVAYDMATTISSNKVFLIEDYEDPNAGNGQGGGQVPNNSITAITFIVNDADYAITDMEHAEVSLPVADISGMEFKVKSVTVNGTPYNLNGIGTGQFATAKDGNNMPPMEVRTITANNGSEWVVGLEYHGNDDPEEVRKDVDNTTVPSFMIPQVIFKSSAYKGVTINTANKPDMYDDTIYPAQFDISKSSASAPAKAAVYYGATSFTVAGTGAATVTGLEVTGGIPAGAVSITNNDTVSFNSGYYASIPLKVTLSDGTVGYVQVDRLGLEIHGTNSANSIIYHGSQNGVDMSTVSGSKTFNIVAVFYYDAAKSKADYDVVANLTYANGTTETKVVQGFSEKACQDPTLKGGDYLVWSGDSKGEMPVSVSVTAVKHGAVGSTSFGGAMFGAGKGLTATTFN